MQGRSKIITDLLGTARGVMGLVYGVGRELRNQHFGENTETRPENSSNASLEDSENEELAMLREALANERKQRELLTLRVQELEKQGGEKSASNK